MTFNLVNGDCLEVLKTFSDASVDAVVTDPPYELGFMGKGWDASGIAYNVELWRECLRVLKPGGHLLAFGGTRTYHRMACAIEDAGFEIRDSIHWIYGSGFPKSLDVSKALDKAAGAQREVVGTKLGLPGYSLTDGKGGLYGGGFGGNGTGAAECAITTPATDAAKQWFGWGTALKPAHEPIVVARKPLVGTVADNVQTRGTGALNIDGCRVKPATRDDYGRSAANSRGTVNAHNGLEGKAFKIVERSGDYASPAGRWPPNILLTHAPECHETCAEDCPVAEMDRQSGILKSGRLGIGHASGNTFGIGNSNKKPRKIAKEYGNDSGGASRFFPVFRYQAKASRSERDAGCKELSEVVARSGMGGTMPIDDNGNERDRFSVKAKNHHPTVKPVALMAWLVKLVTPPGGTVLDPFMGSGTTGVAATQEGFGFIGIEREPEYFRICEARVASAVPAQPEQKELFG